MEAAIWGLFGTLVGAGTSIATTYLTNKSSASIQSNLNTEERLERQRAFQRQTLLDLQDAFHNSIRLIAKSQLEDIKASEKAGKWERAKLPDDLSEDLRSANRKVMLLVERVADDSVRERVKAAMTNAIAVHYASSMEESISIFDQATIETTNVIEIIGRTLRGLY